MVSAAVLAFDSWIAARRLQAPALVAQIPLPMAASTASAVVVTLKVALAAAGVAWTVASPTTTARAATTATRRRRFLLLSDMTNPPSHRGSGAGFRQQRIAVPP